MSPLAWAASLVVLALAIGSAVRGGLVGARAGRFPRAVRRLKSPILWLFGGYLIVAGLVGPRTAGESTSPLLWLAAAVIVAYALATLASLGAERPAAPAALSLAALHAGALLAMSAIILALASPAFVPAWLR